MEQEIVRQNFSSGEISEKMYGRQELDVFNNGCRTVKNYITQTQGPANYREGIIHVQHSRLNQVFNLLDYRFNDEQAYGLEFTNKKLRFYRNNGIILEADVTITGISQADPGVVTTSGAHGYEDGDEVFIYEVTGMTEVNGKSYLVANKTATTFELTDIDGNNVDTTGFTAYSANGVCNRVYEIETPYTEANDLFAIEKDQDTDTMFISHPYYLPRELVRGATETSWTLTLPTRTADPFLDNSGSGYTITGITQADPGVVTAVGHPYAAGDVVVIETVQGMTEVNSQPYIVANPTANTFELTDLNGTNVDTTAFTAYSTAGYVSNQNLIPNSVALYESRLWFGGPKANPDKIFASRSPDTNGNTRYTDFTTGTDADHGLQFSINSAEVNKILWLTGTERLLLAGTFGSEIKITGSDDETAITPTNIKARPLNRIGVADVAPINKENLILYVQRGGLTVKSLQFETLRDTFKPTDQNLVAEHITKGKGLWSRLEAGSDENGIKQLTWQTGRPDIMWAVKNNGELLGLTFKPEEGIAGWHRHTTGATGEDKFLTATALPRPSSFDQLWVGTERVVNGNTRRYVGYLADTPNYPRNVDYFTGKDNKATDEAKYQRALLEAQKEYIHLDQALTYNGRDAGIAASASVTPGATTGSAVTFTASAAVFTSDMVDRQIWKRAINGVGTGRAKIVTFNSTTSVDCDILDGADFDSTDAMAAGDWYLTTDSGSGLDHLEGREVKVVTDGGVHPSKTVSSGAITLDYQSAVFHVGLGYEGFLEPMSLEFGGETGPSTSKLKNVREAAFRFSNSLGAEFGTDLYEPEIIPFAQMPLQVGTPQYLFSGIKRIPYIDGWENDKTAYVRQNNPLPCSVQQMIFYGDTEES